MEKICIYCGGIFETKNKNQMFCSISCSNKSRKGKKTHKCEFCGKETFSI